MIAGALSIYRRQFGALVLTCALALVPANLVMAGAVVLGFASLGTGGGAETRTHAEQIQQKRSDLRDSPPEPGESAGRMQQLGREAFGGDAVSAGSAFDPGVLRTVLPMAFALLFAVAVLVAGLSLAHAAVVPVVLGTAAGPARAWAAVAARLHALIWTSLLNVPLLALGMLLFVVPGLVLAVGFAFAMPVVMSEGLSGRAALERSWALSRGLRARIFGMLALIIFFTALGSWVSMLAPVGPWRAAIAGAVRLFALPLPLAGLVLLYQRALSTSAGSPRPDSSARGSPGSLHP